jgi:hypothetical protein
MPKTVLMSEGNSKPGPKPDRTGPGESRADDAGTDAKTTGRVKFDDRGNAVWEWSLATGAFGREVSTSRLQKLEHPALSLADDAPTPVDTVRANPLGTKKGYDPYDSGKLGQAAAARKRKDLRKLSEWLKLRKQVSANNKDGDE